MSAEYRQNFVTLCRAIRDGNVVLLECHSLESGAMMWAICASNRTAEGQLECVPLARMLDDNLGVVVLPAPSMPGSSELN